MAHYLPLALASVAVAAVAWAQTASPPAPPPPVASTVAAESEAERRAVLDRLSDELEARFVFPDVARRYADAIRAKAAAGGYSGLGDRFAGAVVADLQAIHRDWHLRFGPARPSPAAGREGQARHLPDPATAIGRSGWIAGGVAYLELTLFPGDEAALRRVARFLDEHGSARALIFDIRGHHGGGLAEMDLVFARLFSRETLLVGMDTRAEVDRTSGSPFAEGVALRRAPASADVVRRYHYAVPAGEATPLRRAQVYVLTSRRTGSAAEHFALALKRTRRATLIGEPTAGAGHYGDNVDLGSGYTAFIPVGRTFDPDTNQGWEGTGVAPHVQVSAEQALDEALRRAGVDPAQRRTLAGAS